MNFWITVKTLNERGKKKKKKMHNAKLEWHLAGPHALPHMISAFIYIYIDFNNVTVFYKCFYFLFLLILE